MAAVSFDRVGQVVTWDEPTPGIPPYFVGHYFRVAELSDSEVALHGPFQDASCEVAILPEPPRVRPRSGLVRPPRRLKTPYVFTLTRG